MGLIFADMEIGPDRGIKKHVTVSFLVDSGAEYSVVSSQILRKIGVKPYRIIEIVLADGSKLTRRCGDVYFRYLGERAPSPVIFGEENDSPLLGAVTLDSLGFMLDPLQRRVIKRKALRG